AQRRHRGVGDGGGAAQHDEGGRGQPVELGHDRVRGPRRRDEQDGGGGAARGRARGQGVGEAVAGGDPRLPHAGAEGGGRDRGRGQGVGGALAGGREGDGGAGGEGGGRRRGGGGVAVDARLPAHRAGGEHVEVAQDAVGDRVGPAQHRDAPGPEAVELGRGGG